MTTAMAQQIGYYLKKVMEINIGIGGKTAHFSLNKNKDKFTSMKDEISKGFHYIKEKIAEKDKKSARAEHIRIENEIQNRISEIETLLQRMNEYLKKNAKMATQKNLKTYEILHSQVINFKDILSGNVPSDRLITNGDIVPNFSDVRQQLLEPPPPKNKKKQSTRVKKGVVQTDIQMSSKMDQWKKRDQQVIDVMLDGVINQVDQLKVKSKQMGVALDTTIEQINKLDKQVDKVNDGLLTANKDLKGIVDKYKKPTRCCLDITLTIILIGLIVGIIKFAKN